MDTRTHGAGEQGKEEPGRARDIPHSLRTRTPSGSGGKNATLAGKPDLIALKGSDAVIIDAKTGKPSPAHATQVMIYQYAVPKALPEYRGVECRGHVVYRTGRWASPPARWTRSSQSAWAD